MNISILSASDVSLGDGALYAVVGFLIVLAVLALLVGIFYLTGFIFQTKFLSKDNLFERKKKTQDRPNAENSDGESDDEIVAAITAAIACIYADESADGDVVPEFVIRHIKRNK